MIQILVIVLVNFLNLEAAKILAVFPTPSPSHHIFFRPFTRELTNRGHQVTVITTDPENKNIKNLTEIDVKDISYNLWRKIPEPGCKTEEYDAENIVTGYRQLLFNTISIQLHNIEVKKIIDDKTVTFDLVIVEGWARSLIALSHRFNVPIIRISSVGAVTDEYSVLGNMGHPLLYPPIRPCKLHNHTFWEKITELYTRSRIYMFCNSHEAKENAIMRSHLGSNMPPLSELINNLNMMLIGIHRLWEMNRPTSLAVTHIAGIHLNPENELPADLKSYLDSSVHGFIYVSFGTYKAASNLPRKQLKAMVNVLSRLRYNVLWKWDEDDLPGQPANIKTAKWFPQQDILRHPKIKAFITQGGLLSTNEAIYAEVPLIGIPTASDQFYNTEQYVHFKIGITLDLHTLTEEKLTDAISNIITDESYRANIRRLKARLYDSPQTPLERAVWWTEHVLRHGGQHLRSPAHNMSWIEYLEMELVFIVIISAILLMAASIKFIYYSVKIMIMFTKWLPKIILLYKSILSMHNHQ